jgi:hypothetical protein
MKILNQRQHTLAFFLTAPVLFIFLRKGGKIYLPLILTGVLIAGCFRHYYKIESQQTVSSETISKLESGQKIFLAHFNDAIVRLNNIKTTDTELNAVVQALSENELSRAYSNKNSSKQYKPSRDANILFEVHLYIDKNQQSFKSDNSQKVIIPLTSIARMDIYEKDKGRTTTNQIFSAVGVALVVTLGILTIVACNCPQVSIADGNQFEFKSGLYSGAVNANLERSDYLLLDNFAPVKDSLKIRIDNVNGEQQFINNMQLLKVSHPEGTKVLADRNGKIFSYKAPVTPLSVRDNAGKEYNNQVRYFDSENAGFVQPGKEGAASSLVFQFPVNMAGKKARLILRANNTAWSGHVYKEFQGLYGNAYTSMRDIQEKMDPSVSQNWILNQSLPLKVYVENIQGEWQMADYFQMPGNTAKRDMIMEIDIPNTPLQTVRIKLETVFRFWEIDYAALDNTEQAGIESTWLTPANALVSTGENALDKISATDKEYVSLTGHAYLDLQFYNLKGNHDTDSYFLCGTGYYHQSAVNANNPDLAALSQFRQPGNFQKFSIGEYEKVSADLVNYMDAAKQKKKRP